MRLVTIWGGFINGFLEKLHVEFTSTWRQICVGNRDDTVWFSGTIPVVVVVIVAVRSSRKHNLVPLILFCVNHGDSSCCGTA